MMKIVRFIPPSPDSAQNIACFIGHWRPMVKNLPNTDSFDSYNWDLSEAGSLYSASLGSSRLGVYFTKMSKERRRIGRSPLNQPLQDLAKAFVLKAVCETSPKGIITIFSLVTVWRYLEVGLLARNLPASSEFLTPDILDEVNLAIRTSKQGVYFRYALCCLLNRMVDTMQECGLIQTRFHWRGVTIHVASNFSRIGEEHDRHRNKNLPTENDMQALGTIFHNAESTRHRYPIAIATILAGQPGRIGEVLTLPVDCAFDDERGGKKIFRLRWHPEKGGAPMTKDFSYSTCPWVQHFKTAIEWLTEISRPARMIARWYEEHPTRLHLPDSLEYLRSKEWLSLEETAAILQVNQGGGSTNIERGSLRPRNIPIHGERYKTATVRFEDVERAVIAELPNGFPVMNPSTGMKYSEALCLYRCNEFGNLSKCDDSPSHTMFASPHLQKFSSLLSRAFDDFQLRNVNGDPIRFRSHQFRHRWCTRAEEAGIWRSFSNAMSGRLVISQANAYDWMTADHVLKVLPENLKDDGRLFGELLAFIPKEPIYFHEAERQIEELAMLKAIVVTPYGICTNDFVQAPCEYHLDCLNCRNHACIKGLPVRTENIRKRLALQEKALALSQTALENGDYGVKDHIKNTLEPNVQRLRAIVTILDDPRFKFGTEIILANGPNNHPITKALQLRIASLKEQGLETTTEEAMLLPPGKAFDLRLDSEFSGGPDA